MIERIEHLCAELDLEALDCAEFLKESKIAAVESRRAQVVIVGWPVAKREGCGLAEVGGVEVRIQALVDVA